MNIRIQFSIQLRSLCHSPCRTIWHFVISQKANKPHQSLVRDKDFTEISGEKGIVLQHAIHSILFLPKFLTHMIPFNMPSFSKPSKQNLLPSQVSLFLYHAINICPGSSDLKSPKTWLKIISRTFYHRHHCARSTKDLPVSRMCSPQNYAQWGRRV